MAFVLGLTAGLQTPTLSRDCATPLSSGARPSESPNQISPTLHTTQPTSVPPKMSDQRPTRDGTAAANSKQLPSSNVVGNQVQSSATAQGSRPVGKHTQSKPAVSSQVSLFSLSEESFDSELDLSLSTSPAWKPGLHMRTGNHTQKPENNWGDNALEKKTGNDVHRQAQLGNTSGAGFTPSNTIHHDTKTGSVQGLRVAPGPSTGQGKSSKSGNVEKPPMTQVQRTKSANSPVLQSDHTPVSTSVMHTPALGRETPSVKIPSISGETPPSRVAASMPVMQTSTSSVNHPILRNPNLNVATPSISGEIAPSRGSVSTAASGSSRQPPSMRTPSMDAPGRNPPVTTPASSVRTPSMDAPARNPSVSTPASSVRTPSVETPARTPSGTVPARTPSVETPASSSHSSLSTSNKRKRKFPGPAGLLPKLVSMNGNKLTITVHSGVVTYIRVAKR